MEGTFSKQEEDALLKDSTGDLPDWIENFIRRVILLLENLPDEDSSGNADGATEGRGFSFAFVTRLVERRLFSASDRCCFRCLQSDLRSPFGQPLRHGPQDDLRLCEQQRAVKCRPCYPSTRRMCCERKPGEDTSKVLLFLREEHQDRTRERCELAPDDDDVLRSVAF
jgi:hypothetical protein